MLMLAGIDDPKLDSTAFHPSSSSHSLPHPVVCHPGHHDMSAITGDLFYGFSALHMSLSVGRQSVSVSATVTAVSEPSVSAAVSVTAITGLQFRRHFRLRPKPVFGFGRSLFGAQKTRPYVFSAGTQSATSSLQLVSHTTLATILS